MDLQSVNYVSLYLRKSRGDEETALEKHKAVLMEIVQRHGWKFEVLEEIGTSDSIDYRPKVVKLLSEVADGIYDAVLVVDLDRFSRGDLSDQARWRKAFESSGTLIITPTNVYNLANDETALMADIEGVFARHEYRMIVKRLRQGKRIGAKMGRWTNGPAPMPYVYNPVTRQLDVDPEKLEVYELIKRRALDNAPLYKLAVELNLMGVPSPKGGMWTATTIHRMMTSEVHLGRIVQNKSTGSYHQKKKAKPLQKNPRDEWVVAEGTHQPVKTPEEHLRILELFERRKMAAPKARAGIRDLSGLVRCGLCGSSLQFLNKPRRMEIKKCQHMDPMGNVCPNRGADIAYVYRELNRFLAHYKESLTSPQTNGNGRRSDLESKLKLLIVHIADLTEAVERIQDLYIMKRFSKTELEERLSRQDQLIREARDEMKRLREVLASDGPSSQERLSKLEDALKVIGDPTAPSPEKNRLLKKVVSRILFTRVGDDISVACEPI